MIRLPYRSFPVQGTRNVKYEIVYRPMLTWRVSGPIGEYEVTGLVDIGADDTLFTDRFIHLLGVVIQPGDHAIIVGIEGSMTVVRYGVVDLDIPGSAGGHRWSARVGFHAGQRIVFGQVGFLEHFTANFNGRSRHLTLTPNRTGRAS